MFQNQNLPIKKKEENCCLENKQKPTELSQNIGKTRCLKNYHLAIYSQAKTNFLENTDKSRYQKYDHIWLFTDGDS